MRMPTLLTALALMLQAMPALALDWLYLTAPRDTLIGIGQKYLTNPKDWPRIQGANKIRDPRKLPANTHLRIPVELLKVTPAPARVTHVEGNVRVRPEAGTFRPLAPGDQLSGGETVLTGPRSRASFRLADGSSLNQAASSKLIFGRLAAWGATGMVSTELTLESGRLEADASKQTFPGTGFKVATPVAVAGLRGTRFRLNMDEASGVLRNEVLEGGVGISAQGREALVAGGFGTRAEAGKPPETPRPLLPAPDMLPNQPSRMENALRFAWMAHPEARAWRVQVASDQAFRDVRLDELVHQPSYEWVPDLPDGQYVFRVRAVDPAGLEGFNTDLPVTVDTPLPAPSLVEPADGANVLARSARFKWHPVPEAQGYLLRLAGDPQFTQDAVLHHVTRGQELTLDLAEGRHFWRMTSLDESGQAQRWSPTRRVDVQHPPTRPTDFKAFMRYATLFLEWQGNSREYRIEIAADEDFRTIVGRHWTMANRANLIPPKTGQYWLRVWPMGSNGTLGEPSEPIRINVPGYPW